MNGNCTLCDDTNVALALIYGHEECLERLVPQKYNHGLLMEIAMKLSLKHVEVLVEMGVDINVMRSGKTPIHSFASSKLKDFWFRERSVNEFLSFCELGANPYIPSSEGTTLFDEMSREARDRVESKYRDTILTVETKEPDCI
jgi:hypothetical protein